MGIDRKVQTIDAPLYAEWWVEKVGFYTETGKGAVRHLLHFLEPNQRRNIPNGSSILSQFRDITWGDSHCVMLDTKGRLFSMGASQKGRLGLADRDLPGMVKQPTQITIGLP